LSRDEIFESFKGEIFEEWEGKMSINGTIEGVAKLGRADTLEMAKKWVLICSSPN